MPAKKATPAPAMPSIAGRTTEDVLREALAKVEMDHDLESLVGLKLAVTAVVDRFDARHARAAKKAGKAA